MSSNQIRPRQLDNKVWVLPFSDFALRQRKKKNLGENREICPNYACSNTSTWRDSLLKVS